MLGLFYVAAGLLSLTIDDSKNAAILVVMMAAIPTCGFFALATERLIQYSGAGSFLGIPNHVAGLRRGQVDLMCLLIGIPGVIAMMKGAPFNLAALLFVSAAMGVLLTLYARWAFALWIVFAVLGRIANSYHLAADFSSPIILNVLIAASIPILWWWLSLAFRVEARAQVSRPLADARHERTIESRGEALAVDVARLANHEESTDRAIASVISGISDSGLTSRALSLGLGFDLRPR
jgi:hypothetical protein